MVDIDQCTGEHVAQWSSLRARLWPEAARSEHASDTARILEHPDRYVAYVALEGARAVGFAEGSLRHDYVNGCATSPVGFLEGIYVCPEYRRQGLARALCDAVQTWARKHGCAELASDALLENTASHGMHHALGFEETERVVYFQKAT